MNSRQEQLVSKLNAIKFKELEEYHFGPSLVLLLDYYNVKQCGYSKLWNYPTYNDAYQVRKRTGNVMFLFSTSYKGRRDLEKCFLNAANLMQNKIIVMPVRAKLCREFSVKEKALMGIWVLQMGKTSLSFKEKIFCANLLMSGKRNLKRIVELIKENKIRSVVTLADVHMIDYLATAYCNMHGIKTVTLQHGFFPLGDPFFRYSESKYFLTYGEYTKKIANRTKRGKGNFIAVGMPEYIGEKAIEKREIKKRKSFLVLLNGSSPEEHSNNCNMLKICTEFANSSNCAFGVLPHPDSREAYLKEYRKIASNRGNFVKIKADALELLDNYNFCVANATTMSLKAVHELIPVLLYCKKGCAPFYQYKLERLYFSNYLEFERSTTYLLEHNIEDILIELRDYLCGSGDIAKNYLHFYAEL